jgi:GAF domain-containing protein
MTDVPDEYIEIESGVGSANPRSILIVPLQIEEEVLGIIELASFNTLDNYEIDMVEKIADSISSSLANARINMQTAVLLERSRDQEKLMIEQEKELEQSLDEIKKLTNRVYELEGELDKLSGKETEIEKAD